MTTRSLAEIAQYEIPSEKPRFTREEIAQRIAFQKTLNQYLMDEKVAAIIDPSRSGDAGLVFVQGGASYKPGDPAGVPSLVMAIENYGRLTRLLDRNIPVELEIDVRNQFYDSDPNAYNTIAEIPGSDKKDELVMLGAHLDSWHAGTGATDNAAGSAVVMEAIRILKAIGFKPRRTIRVGLWSGEEEGLLGSRAYVAEHFGSHAPPTDPKELAHAQLAAERRHAARPSSLSRPRFRRTSTSTTAPARFAASICRRTKVSRPSSRTGCSPSPTSA